MSGLEGLEPGKACCIREIRGSWEHVQRLCDQASGHRLDLRRWETAL
jgi:hypothetical protein